MITIASSLERTDAITHKLSLTIYHGLYFVLIVMIIKELLYISYIDTPCSVITLCNTFIGNNFTPLIY